MFDYVLLDERCFDKNIYLINVSLMKSTEEEYSKWKTYYDDLWKNACPLCDCLSDAQRELIIWEWEYWYVIRAKFWYTNTWRHLMAVPYSHRPIWTDLTKEELWGLSEVYLFMREYFWDESYFSCTRETFDGRSLEHYHMHFMNWVLKWKSIRWMLGEQGLF